MLRLKLQYFGHLMQRANSWCWEKLKAGGEEGNRMKWLDGTTDLMDMNLGKLWEMVRDRETWRAVVHGVTKSRTQLGEWTTTYIYVCVCVCVCVYLYMYVVFIYYFWLRLCGSLQELSSPPRDWTYTSCSGSLEFTGPPRNPPVTYFKDSGVWHVKHKLLIYPSLPSFPSCNQ